MRKIITIVAGFLFGALILGSVSQQASATSTVPSCHGANTSTASGQCADISSSSSSSNVTSASYAAVTTKGKIVLTSFVAGGMSKKAQHHTTCKWVKGGWNALRDDANNPHWIKWPYKTKICRSKSSPTGWVKVGSKDHTGWPKNCKNFFKLTKPARSIRISQVLYVKSFANWTFTGHVAVKASASATSTAKAWCNTSSSSASGNGSATANSSARTSASYRVKGLSKIKAWVKSESAKLKESFRLSFSAYIQSSAKSTAATRASAQAKCSSTPPPSTCPPGTTGTPPNCVTPPPPPPSAPTLTITQLNDVDAGANSPNYCATATLPGTDNGVLTFSADFGSFQPSTSYSVSGQATDCPTYVAPTEVPAGGTDTITVTIKDSKTGLVTSKTSAPFRINPPAVHPA